MTCLLLNLPVDVVISILYELDAIHMAMVSRTCKALKSLVDEFGWSYYTKRNPRPSFGLEKFRTSVSPQASAQYNNRSDLHWDRASIDGAYVARPLQMDWHGKLQPLLAISPYHLIVAAGRTMYFNVFEGDRTTGPSIRHGAFYTHPNHDHITNDITSISILEDDGFQCHVLVGFHMGSIHEFVLEGAVVTPHYPPFQFLHNESIESLHADGTTLLSLASNGHAALTNMSTSDSSHLLLEGRSWTSYMSLQSPAPFAAFGSSSSTPLVVYTMSNDGFVSEPSAILGMSSKAGPDMQSAVYGISAAPPASPWGSSPQIIASGWYDGRVRCYDLRASLRGPSQSGSPPILYPVMSVYDPLLCEPIYSVSCGGGSASHIAAGSARHSVVSFWDVRFPKLGWSVHAPGNDPSPVYDVILESSRLYGATQSRTFVIDMGPGITEHTHPYLQRRHNRDGLVQKDTSDIGFYVTQYLHRPNLRR